MIVQLLGGIAILCPATTGPMVANNFGLMPCGVFHSIDNGNGPGTFRLSLDDDGDLITQAWYAWVAGGTSGGPTGTGSDTFVTPDNVSAFLAEAVGGGGAGNSWQGAAFNSSSGGGGGAYAPANPAVVPGVSYPFVVGTGGTRGLDNATGSWFSLSGVRPVAAFDGCYADFGHLPPPGPGSFIGQAGVAVNCVGTFPIDGGAGVFSDQEVFPLLGGAGGGGGGGAVIGAATAGADGAVPTGGAGGTTGGGQGGSEALPCTGADGVTGGGGGGGGLDTTATVLGLGGLGGNGAVSLTWTGSPGIYGVGGPGNPNITNNTWTLPAQAGPIITVIESFDIVDPPPPQQYLTVPLPTLNAAAIESLKELQAQILAKESVMEAPTDAG
jgi:hypothetical protein